MANYVINTSAPNLAVVCLDSVNPVIGSVNHYYSYEGISFDSIDCMIKIISELCDTLDYPQQTVSMRSFLKAGSDKEIFKEAGEKKKVITKPELINKRGDKGTFAVHVQYRQNATWQGQVTWIDKGQTQNFRSALELIKLMDSAMDATEREKGGDSDNEG